MAQNPLIIIPGPAVSEINIVDSNGKKVSRAWPPTIDQQAITNLLKGSLMKMMLLRKDAGFSDGVAQIVSEAIEPLSVNPDGTKKHNTVARIIRTSYKDSSAGERAIFNKAYHMDELAEKLGEENLYIFCYDMFGDIYNVAENLHKFIKSVKANTSAQQVDILCISLGGVVLKAYLQEYSQENDIQNVISIATLMNGTSLIADAFENKLEIKDTKALLALLGEKGESLSSAMSMLPPDAIENSAKKCIDIVRKKLLCNCTMMWACIPNDRFDAIYSALVTKGSELDKKVTKLHEYSMNLASEISNLEKNMMNFNWICSYGIELLPITTKTDISSDGIADVNLASFGASCATVDSEPELSECAFPLKTCAIKGVSHFSIHNDRAVNDMVANTFKKLANK